MQTGSSWNSLEIVRLLVLGLTPILIALIGLYINRTLKKFEHIQWRNQKLIEKRLTIYDELAPLLNDLLCYYTFVGNWKELKPADIITYKRIIDKKIYLASPLFSADFFREGMAFLDLCFETFTGWGEDAKLRTTFESRKTGMGLNWDDSWNKFFCDAGKQTPPEKIKQSYIRIMQVFSDDIGLEHNEEGKHER